MNLARPLVLLFLSLDFYEPVFCTVIRTRIVKTKNNHSLVDFPVFLFLTLLILMYVKIYDCAVFNKEFEIVLEVVVK